MKKRLLALLMVLALLITCVPTGVVAEGTEDVVIDNVEQLTEQQTEAVTEEATQQSEQPVKKPATKDASEPKHDHSAQQHDCPHCEGEVTWTELKNGDALPTATGHYVLMESMDVSAQARIIGDAEVVICLNGYTIDASGCSRAVFRADDTAKLIIDDCAAVLDENGMFVSGGSIENTVNTVTPGGAIYATEQSQVTLRNVKFANNDDRSAGAQYYGGGAVHARHDVVLNISGCLFQENKSCDGGAIGTRGYTQVTINNTIFKENEATTNGGAINFTNRTTTSETNASVTKNAASLSVTNCVFEGNGATSRGGAIYVDDTEVRVNGGEMTGNTGTAGGAVHCYKGNTTLTGVSITGNKASGSGGSAIYVNGGSAKLKLDGCAITGNQSLGSSVDYRGGVFMTNNSDKLTVSGATVVDDNMVGVVDGVAAAEVNILLQNSGASLNVDGLTAGAKFSVLTHAGAVETPNFLTDVTDPATWDKTWVIYENNGLAVDYDKQKDEFFFTSASTHVHCACGAHLAADETCEHAAAPGCDHSEITYEPWESTNSLPKDPGHYYLTGDVVVTSETPISTNSGIPDIIDLCLNGYTVRVDYPTEGKLNDQVFYMTRTAELTISDCTAHTDEAGNYVAGKLTGGSSGVITAGVTGTSTVYTPAVKLALYDGILSGNTAKSNGGAVNMTAGESTFYMYGGLITENSAKGSGGAVYVGEGNSFRMYGGTITGNAAGSGGAVYVHANAAAVSIEGDSIITDNVAGAAASNLYLGGDITVTVGAMGENANVGISGVLTKLPRRVSTNQAALDGLFSDSKYRPLVLIDEYVYIGFTNEHVHCDCGGADANCKHTEQAWAAWDDPTSLPTGDGYYYLVTDVTLTATASQTTGDLHLCLNGHTVTANGAEGTKNDRVYSVSGDAKLTISDCTASYAEDGTYTAGKLTGGSNGVIFVPNQTGTNEDGTNKVNSCVINLYDGILAGNSVEGYGGAMSVQDGAVFNMYGGEISGNAAKLATAEDGTTSGGNGGAVYVGTNATFNMYGGVITGNTAENSAAVYVCDKSNMNVYGGAITGNTAAKNAGGVIVTGSTTVMTMTGGEISDNIAGGAAGGVLVQSRAALDLQGGKITGNTTAADGGGVYVSSNSSMTMSGGEVSGNTANGYGGGINLYGATFTMTGGTVSGNTAANGAGLTARLGQRTVNGELVRDLPSTVTVQDGSITGNTATATGGGVFLNGNGVVFTMEGGEISKNAATHGGGAITQSSSVFNLAGGKLSENTAVKGGGGIYISYTSNVNMEGGEISNNKTDGNGGGMYVLGAEITLKGGKLSGNYAVTSGGGIYATYYKRSATETREEKIYTAKLDLTGVTVSGNKTDGNGAGVCTSKATVVNLSGGSITGNAAVKAAGGILLQSKSVLNFKGGSVSSNSAKSGGGIYVSTDSFIYMTGGSVSYNTATGNSGGMYLLRCNATLSGGTITGNTAKTNGAGIYMAGATVTLNGTNITDNTAEGNGGGICTTQVKSGEDRYYTTITMTGGTISGNSAVNGGGILTQSKTTMTLKNGVFENNKTSKSGAGLYISSTCTFTMEGGKVQNNEAEVNGAGIYQYKSDGTYTGGVIQNNKATGNAGGLLATGEGYTVTIKDLTVTGNTAKVGGGIVFQGKVVGNIEDGEFTNNTAGNHAGAVYVSTNTFMNVTGGNFSNNTSGNRGGAIYLAVTSNSTIANATFTGNKAVDGGAIFAQSNLTITDSVITGNTASNNGGGICTGKLGSRMFMQPQGLVAKNITVSNNTAAVQGGGLYLNVGHDSDIRNSSITGNTAGAEGGGIWAICDTDLYDLTITGNTSGGEGYALYLAASEYDGESYVKGVFKIAGVMKVQDNQGGDMYIGQQTAVSVAKEGLAEGTLMNIKLHSGYLTQTLYGAYDYEGGNLEYVVTAGDRSVTDPEYDPAYNDQFKTEEPTEEATGEDADGQTEQSGVSPLVWIACGAGAVVIAAVIAIIAALGKKKKAAAKK